jgi:hypothetical protein
MPKTPTGAKRPADVIGNAVHVMRIATGEIEEKPSKKAAAGASGGKKGGKVRAANLTPKERSDAAALAAQARWRRKT